MSSITSTTSPLQVALKRQQAVEDAIALRLAANETGTELQTLPPGKIYGMSVTEPRNASPCSELKRNSISIDGDSSQGTVSGPTSPSAAPSSSSSAAGASTATVSQTALDMLAQLFPHRKRSVLELVLRRCDLDLLRAIEQCSPQSQAGFAEGPFRGFSHQVIAENISNSQILILFDLYFQSHSSAFEGVSRNGASNNLTPTTAPLSSQLPTDLSPSAPPSSHYGSLIAYPKWLLPMSIPVTMGHLPNLMPRCSMPNCPMCLHIN